jgi:hypothetical protein
MWKAIWSRCFGLLDDLSTRSQVGARRNALVASTALVQRRRERAEADKFLADRQSAAADRSTSPDHDLPAGLDASPDPLEVASRRPGHRPMVS